jgi:hypothetical protein
MRTAAREINNNKKTEDVYKISKMIMGKRGKTFQKKIINI